MTWVKLDDAFFQNVKVASVSKDAKLLHLSAMCYCASQLTDGKIPTPALKMIAAQADVDDYRAAVAELCHVNLWDNADGDLSIHDYLKYNPSKQDVMKGREAAAERMRRVRSGEQVPNSDDTAPEQDENSEGTSPNPVPVPIPFPERDPEPKPEVPAELAEEPAARRKRRAPTAPPETIDSVLGDESFLAEQRARYPYDDDHWRVLIENWVEFVTKKKVPTLYRQSFRNQVTWHIDHPPGNGRQNNGRGAPNGSNNGAWSAALGRQIGHGTGRLVEAADG